MRGPVALQAVCRNSSCTDPLMYISHSWHVFLCLQLRLHLDPFLRTSFFIIIESKQHTVLCPWMSVFTTMSCASLFQVVCSIMFLAYAHSLTCFSSSARKSFSHHFGPDMFTYLPPFSACACLPSCHLRILMPSCTSFFSQKVCCSELSSYLCT